MNPIVHGVKKIKGFFNDLVKRRDHSSRLNPMTISFTSIMAIFIIERIDEQMGTISIMPLLFVGLISISGVEKIKGFFNDLVKLCDHSSRRNSPFIVRVELVDIVFNEILGNILHIDVIWGISSDSDSEVSITQEGDSLCHQ